MDNVTDHLKHELNKLAENNNFKDSKYKIHIVSNNKNSVIIDKGNELTITIEVNQDEIVDYQFKFSDSFLKDCLNTIADECQKRGLLFSVEKMRIEILDDLHSICISNLTLENVVNFTDGLLLFQYLNKYILLNLHLPKDLWHSKDVGFELWKKDHRLPAIIAGHFDGYIDEIISIPTAIYGIYGVYFDETLRNKILLDYLNSEQYLNLFDFEEKVAEFPDEELRMHNSVQTIVSVSFLMNFDKMHEKFKQT